MKLTDVARRIGPAQVIAPVSIVVALSGTAVAASGDAVVLGRPNSAHHVTSLRNTNGTPLTLVAKANHPPLSVKGNSTQVPSLNATLLGGLTGKQLQPRRLLFSKPGLAAFAVPRGYHHMLIAAVGGGGAGGDEGASSGSGGAAGAFGEVYVTSAPGTKWTASVGAGGTFQGQSHDALLGKPTTVYATAAGSMDRVLSAGGGQPGDNGSSCGSTIYPADGGYFYGPLQKQAAVAVGLDQHPGAQGGGTTYPNGCGGFSVRGIGANHGFAGAGGNGAGGNEAGQLTVGEDGQSGAVLVEFLR